ncbi:MAG TPA: sigma-70 family RNA polymerase sigma factor [Polyangiaceae bacterium]|nr:sigma-70 family RNA polymerase sigma factor [Polyangiaceae bacterium]
MGVPDTPEVLERFHAELSLVEIVARQVARTIGRAIELDDLVASGREGLLDAARRFDPTRGVPFRAYANLRVRGAILDGVRQNSLLPRRTYERVAALKAAAEVSEGEAEYAFAAGPVPDAAAADRALAEHLSSIAMAAAVGMVVETRAADQESEDSPEDALVRAQLIQRVRTAVAELSSEESELIRRHYLEGERLDLIAKDLDMSKSWASRLHTRAVARLSKRLRDVA